MFFSFSRWMASMMEASSWMVMGFGVIQSATVRLVGLMATSPGRPS